MKKRILSVALLVSAWGGYSQVGIGTLTPDKSSQLDVTANDKGTLIPRVSLTSTTDTTTITNGNVNSLLVFNTATQNDITPGYYYWYIDKWKRIVNEDEVGGNVYYDGDQFTYVDASGDTHVINFEEIVQANETVTTLVNNNDGTYTYTNEADVAVIIDVPADVINNIETILGDTNVLNELIEVLGDTYVGGNVYYDGDTFTYIDENGDTHEIDFEELVQANESQTLLVQTTEEDQQYYVAEEYLQNNPAPAQTEIDSWNPTALPADVYTINFVGGVTNNFQDIYNNIVNEEIVINGDTYNSFEEYLQEIVNVDGSVRINIDETTNQVSFEMWDETTNSWVTINNNQFEEIVQANESQTLLVQTTEEDQQYYVAEEYLQNNPAPTQTEIDSWNPTALPAGVYTINFVGGVTNNFQDIYNNIVNEEIVINGDTYNSFEEYVQEIVNVDGSVRINIDETTNQVSFEMWDETTNSWVTINNNQFEEIVQANETVTTFVDNGDGTCTYTSEDGTVTTVDVPADVVNQFEDIYNNIVNEEIVINGDTYNTFEEYLQHIVETNETVTTFVDNGDGTYTYTSEDGTVTTVDVPADVVNQFEDIYNNIVNEEIVINGDTYNTFEEYLQHIVETNETVTTFVDNGDGTYTYTSEDGTVTTVDVPADVVNQFEDIYNNIVNEEIVINGDTYNSFEEYLQHIVETNQTLTSMTQDLTTGVITYTDEEGEDSTANVVSTDDGNEIIVGSDGGAYYKAVKGVVSVNANHTVDEDEDTVLIDGTSGDLSVTIPTAAPANSGRIIVLRKMDMTGSTVTLSESINGGPFTFNQFNVQATITIQSDGTNWYLIN